MNIFSIMTIAAVVFVLLSVALISVWVYKDAKQRGLSVGLWTLLVVLSGGFIGLILYLLIGRKQNHSVCGKCGAAIHIQGSFCPVCGEKIDAPKHVVKKNKGLINGCIACIVLTFVSLGTIVFLGLTSEGFIFQQQYSYYYDSSDGSAKNTGQSSSGNQWTFSYDEAYSGYTLTQTYNAKSKPVSLLVDISCSGTVQMMITQGGASITETLGEGSYHYDMADFKTGRIRIKLINVDATDLSGKIVMETGKYPRKP